MAMVVDGLGSTTRGSWIDVYPNPTRDYVFLQVATNEQVTVANLFNAQGQTIAVLPLNTEQEKILKIPGPPGIYPTSSTHQIWSKRRI